MIRKREIEEVVRSFADLCVACRRSDSDRAIDCQQLQGEAKRSYRGFVTVHCSSFSFVWKGRYFILVSVYCVLLRFIKFMSRCCGDCAFSASFVRECTDVTGAPNVNFRKISVGKTI